MSHGIIYSGFGLKWRMMSFVTDAMTKEGKKKPTENKKPDVIMVSPFDSPDLWNAQSGEKSRSLCFSDTVTPNKTKCPISVVAESPPRTRKWLHSSVHVIQ